MEKKLICISCPTGCRLTARRNNESEPWTVEGNRCPRGKIYAETELSDPRRIVTATVACDSAEMPRIPVRTDQPLPKQHIDALLNELYRTSVHIPVRRGEVLIADVEHTQINVIFSCNCSK